MRKPLILSGLVIASVSSAALGQSTANPWEEAFLNTVGNAAKREQCDLVNGQIVCNTQSTPSDTTVADIAAQALLAARAAAVSKRGAIGGLSWLLAAHDLIESYEARTGQDLLNNSGFGGGGVTSGTEYNDGADCDDYAPRLDLSGRLIVPSVGLRGGSAQMIKDVTPVWTSTNSANLFNGQRRASTSVLGGAPSFNIHKRNVAAGTHRDAWFGCWRERDNGYGGIAYDCAQPQVDSSGSPEGGARVTVTDSPGTTTQPYDDCPAGGFSSGTTYAFWLSNGECLLYEPNPQLGSAGMAYNPVSTLNMTSDDMAAYTFPAWLDACNIRPDVIAKLVDEAVPEIDVEEEDVGIGDEPPSVGDLDEPISEVPPDQPTTNNPPDDPNDPTDPDNPDEPCDSWYCDIGWGATPADDPQLGTFEIDFPTWFELPDFSFTSPACPIYSGDFFGEIVTLETHCPFLEDNRALISALMLVGFTLSAALVVLRA